MSTEAGALRVPRDWSLLLVRTVAIGLLAAAAAIIFWTAVPMIWGWTPAVIVSGSMSPLVHRGDIVVTSPPAADWQPVVGQVVTVPNPNKPGTTVTHRIAGFDEQGRLITRGDANGNEDRFRTARTEVRGIARLLVPRIGTATLLLREGRPGMFVTQSIFLLAAVALVARRPGGSAEAGPADGETPDGETPDGETPDGETPDGETPDGETPDGETRTARPRTATRRKATRRTARRRTARRRATTRPTGPRI
ncbi:S26 family signal peptidase [Actinoplanes sp. NPDC049681]|uniref:S26 family signal peptidase n=1 Tax=Actinoplanes sp. NPDC049681 TaxID=3363905 RepID=UPI0037B2E983